MQTIRKGLINVGDRRLEHIRVYTVTDVSKRVDGVRTVAVLDQDFNGGQLAEQALDYLAEDKDGNVWYPGSYTETYEEGQFVNATDGWLAGVNGSEPGILMQAQPNTGMSYFQSKALGEGAALAQVIKTSQSRCLSGWGRRTTTTQSSSTSGDVRVAVYGLMPAARRSKDRRCRQPR